MLIYFFQENKEKEVISRQVLSFTGSINCHTYVGDFAVACEDIMLVVTHTFLVVLSLFCVVSFITANI